MKNLVKVLFVITLLINIALLIYGLVTLNLAVWVTSLASIVLLACYYIKIAVSKTDPGEKKPFPGKPFPGNCRCVITPMDVCDACGKNPKVPNSQICAECKKKVEE
jgi:hypothetical protein